MKYQHDEAICMQCIEDEFLRELVFEKNKKYFEEKWNTLWIPHKYRDDVKPN